MRKSVRVVVTMLVAALVTVPTVVLAQEYVAYAVTKKGEEEPIPEDVLAITKKNAKKLVELRWSDYAGPQLRVGVLEADNKSGAGTWHVSDDYGTKASGGSTEVPVNGIDAILADSLQKTGRFRVLTRTELGDVLDEQDLGDSGRVAKPSAAQTGQVLGAEYLVQVVINSYEAGVGGKQGGIGGFSRKLRAVGGIKGGKEKSYVSMTFRLINAETSEIEATQVVEATISDLSIGLGGYGWGGAGALGGFLSGYAKTPIGQAVIAAINAGTVELVKQLGNKPLSGSVIKVDGDRVMVNLGEGMVASGDRFAAQSKGEEIIDPDTGVSLGSENEDIGMLEIVEVKEKFSYAKAVGFDPARLSRGDRLVSTQGPEPLKFGPPWK